MGYIISICNPKGGTAKTSTAVNLCCALTTVNKKVLLIDFDPQRSASVALGYEYFDAESTIFSAVLDEAPIEKCIVHYTQGGFDLSLSTEDLIALPTSLRDRVNAHEALLDAIMPIVHKYDFIIIDTPAAMNAITECAICASDYLIIPVCCDFFSVDSMSGLIKKYHELKEKSLTHTKILGILRTMYDRLLPHAISISNELESSFADLMFKTRITYNPKISESSSAAVPVLLYDRTSLGAKEYLSFAGEVLKKLR